MDTLIKNVTIMDGTGDKAFTGAVGMEKGKLRIFRTPDPQTEAKTVLNGAGLTAVPGFIDTHSHGDLTMKGTFATASKITQGITTQVAGQCSFSMFPCEPDPESYRVFSKFIGGIAPHPDMPENAEACESAGTFFRWLDTLDNPVKTYSFIGLGSLRLWAMGFEDRKPDETELKRMKDMLRRCMREGALGLSSGLVYSPCRFASNEEILELLHVVAEEGGAYATHPRNEADHAIEARREAIQLAAEAGVPLCDSHMKTAGRDNWGKSVTILDDVNKAMDSGLRVLMDNYPYFAGNTSLSVSIPPRYLTEGLPGILKALEDPVESRKIEEEIGRKSNYDNYIYNAGGFSGTFVSSCPEFHDAESKFITDYAKEIGVTPFEAYRQILLKNHGLGLGIYFHLNKEDVYRIFEHPFCAIGTDGLLGLASENAHPRTFGTMPRAYRLLTEDTNICTPEQAIHRMTGLTAEFLRLDGKGFLQDGKDADVLLLDLDNFRDTSTYENGTTRCTGIEHIFVGGKEIEMEKYR